MRNGSERAIRRTVHAPRRRPRFPAACIDRLGGADGLVNLPPPPPDGEPAAAGGRAMPPVSERDVQRGLDDRDREAIVRYLDDIGAIPLLTREKETEIGTRLAEGRAMVAGALYGHPLTHASIRAILPLLESGAVRTSSLLTSYTPQHKWDEARESALLAGRLKHLARLDAARGRLLRLLGTVSPESAESAELRRRELALRLELAHACAGIGLLEAFETACADAILALAQRVRDELALAGHCGSPRRKTGAEARIRWIESQAELPAAQILSHARAIEIGRGIMKSAQNELADANLRLVVFVAKNYTGSGMPLEDLYQEGNLGLLKAALKFDVARGYRFTTYAAWWIRHFIQRAIAVQARLIRIPVHTLDAKNRISKALEAQRARGGGIPDDAELAAQVGFSAERVGRVRKIAPEPVSLSLPMGDGSLTLGDCLTDADAEGPLEHLLHIDRSKRIDMALAELTRQEARVIRARYGLVDRRPLTLEQIAVDIGISRERVRQIEQHAMEKLRHPKRRKVLEEYAD